jgi:hypothetical protein
MTTKITKIAAFQETIAKPSGADDLLREILDVQSDRRKYVVNVLTETVTAVGDLLDQLHQDDFELLIELIFSSSGWKRISRLGGTQKTIDMAMELPTTRERCFVQVKSQINQSTFTTLVEDFKRSTSYSRMFFAYHSPAKPFAHDADARITIWPRYEIAEQVIRAGLVNWVLDHTT